MCCCIYHVQYYYYDKYVLISPFKSMVIIKLDYVNVVNMLVWIADVELKAKAPLVNG